MKIEDLELGDYVYYFDGKDTYPCEVVKIKKRVKIFSGDWYSWVSVNNLELQIFSSDEEL